MRNANKGNRGSVHGQGAALGAGLPGPDFDEAVCRFFKEHNGDPPGMSLKDFLYCFERAIIMRTLTNVNGCQRRAARLLKLKNTTLNRKVKAQHIHFTKVPVWSSEEWPTSAEGRRRES